MPVYEYECTKCNKRFEYMQKMSDSPRKKCEACGGKLDRLISASGFQLKGTGWYKTDYASKPAPSGDRDKGGDSKTGDTKSSGNKSGDSTKTGESTKSESKDSSKKES